MLTSDSLRLERAEVLKPISTLTVALVIFGLAGSAVMVAVPGLFAGPVRPDTKSV